MLSDDIYLLAESFKAVFITKAIFYTKYRCCLPHILPDLLDISSIFVFELAIDYFAL